MNMKEMIATIVMAMLVMTVFASTAMAITVDGTADIGEWDGCWLCDDTDIDPVSTPAYNITSLWACIKSGTPYDTLYVRLDLVGVPGDADGDNDNTDGPVGHEYPGVGTGALSPGHEQYVAKIDSDNDGDIDYYLKYCMGGSHLYDQSEINEITDATTDAAHVVRTTGGPVDNEVIELSVLLDANCTIALDGYCITGWADTWYGGAEDETDPVCRAAPVVMLDGDDVCLGSPTSFTSTVTCTSPCTVAKYKWDFDNDGTYELVGTYPSPSYTYTTDGTYTVKLTVVDTCGQEGSDTTSVTVYANPTVSVSASTYKVLPGGSATFTGTVGVSSGATYDYTWEITGQSAITGTIASSANPPPQTVTNIQNPVTAKLTVVDVHGCTNSAQKTVKVGVEDVPLLTLPGLLALIGMMCIVGAGRIITRGRRP